MISKPEFEYTKIRIKKIEDSLFDYELKNPLYRKYDAYKKMSPQEKEKLQKEWNEYYERVRQTPIWKDMVLGMKALKNGQVELVKEIARRNKDYNTFLPKPPLEDPEFLEYKMSRYHEVKTLLKVLKAKYDEYLPLYGSKKEINSL